MLPVLVTLGMLAAAWYVLITRPQRANQHRHAGIVGQLKTGDHVMTVGGIYGRVETVEGNSVVVEIAPGMSTRVATDGIARIVPAESAPAVRPTPVAHHAPPSAPQPMVAQQQAYPQHYAPPSAPQPMVVQHHPQQVAPVPGQQIVFRASAALQPAAAQPAQGFAPQQWVAPGSDQQVQPAQHPYHQAPAPPPPPAIGGYSGVPAIAAPAVYGQPAPAVYGQPAPAAYGQPAPAAYGHPAPAAYGHPAPVAYAQPVNGAPHLGQQAHQPPVESAGRRRSSAPQGMGTAARIDTELQQTFDRARQEREELAGEYRRITAPLVGDAGSQPPTVHGVQAVPQPHAGAPLFVGHAQSTGQPIAQYPAPAQLPHASPPDSHWAPASVEAAFDSASNPFHRPTPYAPQPATSAG